MDIAIRETAFDVSLHPSAKVVATGCINGQVASYNYEISKELMMCSPHKQGVFAISYTLDGCHLLTGSSDESICVLDASSGQIVRHINDAHEAGVSCLVAIDQNLFVSADDGLGIVRLWDMRNPKDAVRTYQYFEDYVSDMVYNADKKKLLASSGDGSIGIYDLRKDKIVDQTYSASSDYLSLSLMKNKDLVVCGTLEGTLEIFKWGMWGNYHDSIPGTEHPIDTMASLSDDILCYGGGEDGLIHIQSVHPNRKLKKIDAFEDAFILSLRAGNGVLAVTTDHSLLRVYNVDEILGQLGDNEEDQDEGQDDKSSGSSDDDDEDDEIYPIRENKRETGGKRGNKTVVRDTREKQVPAAQQQSSVHKRQKKGHPVTKHHFDDMN